MTQRVKKDFWTLWDRLVIGNRTGSSTHVDIVCLTARN